MFKLTINLHDDGTVIMDEIISKMYNNEKDFFSVIKSLKTLTF